MYFLIFSWLFSGLYCIVMNTVHCCYKHMYSNIYSIFTFCILCLKCIILVSKTHGLKCGKKLKKTKWQEIKENKKVGRVGIFPLSQRLTAVVCTKSCQLRFNPMVTFPTFEGCLVKVLFLFKEYTLSLRAVEQSNYELPDISDLLTTHTMAASKPQGVLAKQPTQTTRLLSNDRTDLLFIIHASSSHDHDQTFIITLTMCGVHAKSLISLLFFCVCFCPSCTLSSGEMCSSL